MQLTSEERVAAPVARVWALFADPAALARCTPGCEQLTESGPDTYQATFSLGVGGIKGKYSGSLRLMDKVQEQEYRIEISMAGAPGFVRGVGHFRFEPEGDATRVSMSWDVAVGGLVAGVGQRMLGSVARMVTGQFFQNLARELTLPV
ncbi:MAG TPA: carbon monoxide dehydrogenase subunit G [Symbiobacteriaceae bacterium]|nr:carbon monoxide dehydrogenase subunit G [Symbiobacteriaceae bacterium]